MTDCIPARTSLQAMGLLFRFVDINEEIDGGLHKVFHRMVMPNVNVRRIDMSRLTENTEFASLTNAIMADAEKAHEMIPNLDAKLSILPYKFTYDGPHEDKAQLFSCTGLTFDNKYTKNVPTNAYADQLTSEDVKFFLKLFKINSDTDDPLIALQLFLQKYQSLHTREEWEKLTQDVGFIDSTDLMTDSELHFAVAEWIQSKSNFGLMATNGAHRISLAVYYGENQKFTTATTYKESKEHLFLDPSEKKDVPETSILYQPVTVNIHYPKVEKGLKILFLT